MIPTNHQRSVAELFVAREANKRNLHAETEQAKMLGTINESKTMARLAHLHERWRRSEQDAKMFLCVLAANPEYWPHLVMWMVDIRGVMSGDIKQFTEPEVKALAASDPAAFKKKMVEVAGSQMEEVFKFISEIGFIPTDRQLSDDNSWVIGTPCTDVDANSLCGLMYRDYAEEIQMGIIEIRKMPWNLGIEGITNAIEAAEWLQKNE